MVASTLARQIGSAIKEIRRKKRAEGLWYSPHMAAASRAISERLPLVDLIVELRDARVFSCLLNVILPYGLNQFPCT